MTLETAFARNSSVEEAPLQGDLMLFEPSTSKFFVLNQTMAFLWRSLDGERTLATVLDRLKSEFDDVNETAAAADLTNAAQELVSLGLVTPVGAA